MRLRTGPATRIAPTVNNRLRISVLTRMRTDEDRRLTHNTEHKKHPAARAMPAREKVQITVNSRPRLSAMEATDLHNGNSRSHSPQINRTGKIGRASCRASGA